MNDKKAIEALKAAFPNTLPILAGFIVLGMGYGIYLRSSGLPVWYPTLTSIVVFGGSLEFLLVPFGPGPPYILWPDAAEKIQRKRLEEHLSHILHV